MGTSQEFLFFNGSFQHLGGLSLHNRCRSKRKRKDDPSGVLPSFGEIKFSEMDIF